MTIVYLYTALTTIGGADRIITQKMNYLADQLEYNVYVITDTQMKRPPVFPLSPRVKHIDLEIDFGQQYTHSLPIRFFIYKKLMHLYKKRLTNILQHIKADIVISTLGRDMDFLTSLNDGSLKIGESHIAKPFMRNFHLMEAKGGIYKIIARYWRNKQEKSIKKLDEFVVLTQQDADNWNSIRSTTVITNPIIFEPKNISPCIGKQIISVGRLNEQKGYDMLIKAWEIVVRKHPDWYINIYGDGELRTTLEQEIQKLELQNHIKLLHPVTNIEDEYVNSAFYVMSSRFEGFALALIEAMSCGLPCVSFMCPNGPVELIRHNEDGLLVENGNITALAESICYIIENEDIRIRMGQKAKENIQRYSKESIMAQWDALFQSLSNKKL